MLSIFGYREWEWSVETFCLILRLCQAFPFFSVLFLGLASQQAPREDTFRFVSFRFVSLAKLASPQYVRVAPTAWRGYKSIIGWEGG